MEPDLAGFAAAMAEKREKFGQDVPFFTPTQTVWPSGIATNLEGTPLDPSVQPLASGFGSAVVRVDVVNRPIAGGARGIKPHSEQEAIGFGETTDLVLLMGIDDYSEAIEDATDCEVYGSLYSIRDRIPDQMGPGPVQRMIIFVEKK